MVITNPPVRLKSESQGSRLSGCPVHDQPACLKGVRRVVRRLEIGLVYLELAHRLLRVGGRVGIVLPETYFFSKKYSWLAGWMDGRFSLRGMLNIPMEAFEEFCRAKTNFYIFEKTGNAEG